MSDLRPRYRTVVQDSSRWDNFQFRPGDIVICTPPKCGTTWMQMLCALLIFRSPELPAPLAELSPWLDMQTRPVADVLRDLDEQGHRRFIKSHVPLDGLPLDERVTYVGVARDPRDVALSWDNHMANLDLDRFMTTRIAAVGAEDLDELGVTGPPPAPPDDPLERFWRWVDGAGLPDDVAGLESLVGHIATFWDRVDEPNVALFHYSDLRADLPGQMARLAACLGVDPPTVDLVQAATFSSMKERADELVPNSDTPFWRSNTAFFDRARAGEWKEFLDAAGQRRFDDALARLAPPALASFLVRGWLD
jgi:aryl sulfotransferase